MVFLGAGLGMAIAFMISMSGIDISQETGDDICKNLTGNESAVAYDWDSDSKLGFGKFGCKIPSYDSTQNIIIKKNNE